MTEIEKRKADRYRMLNEVYEASSASTICWLDVKKLCSPFEWDEQYLRSLFAYLVDEELLKLYGAGLTAFLTHKGIVAIEKAHSDIRKATEHFPALDDIEHIILGIKKKL